jgi:hypothetical protein
MTVHVGELTSEVVPEPEPASGGQSEGGGGWTWQELDRQEDLLARLRWERERTCADGFDD